jgi:hypothetical protein
MERERIDTLLHPSQVFERPSDVVNDPDMSLNEERAVLAAWASDACAIEAAPALRRTRSGARCRSTKLWMPCACLIGHSAQSPVGIWFAGDQRLAAAALVTAIKEHRFIDEGSRAGEEVCGARSSGLSVACYQAVPAVGVRGGCSIRIEAIARLRSLANSCTVSIRCSSASSSVTNVPEPDS